ncbi:hypothetical protein [Ramlibacter humi]|uniref:Uncharacterized protein n=1 Tax=Ramlibacter humi TaxID=2530451 RepID=A0A4Z0BGW4_9BURK|nr:hypothetical protein [Ramlibacter humi]TFY97713.1 hypothetical protein EZ216_18500 [Ramlibacter humi]
MVETPKHRPGGTEPQPWHAADEKKPARGGHAPAGTHSLTGGGAQVGMPEAQAAERGEARDEQGPAEPDPLLEPRANIGEILGRKP